MTTLQISPDTRALLNALAGLQQELAALRAQVSGLARILQTEAPNYQRPLDAYGRFDWASIGAVIVETDISGVSVVEFAGHRYTRRAGSGKFGRAVWFSRPAGKNPDGSTAYPRLVTFKNYSEPEPVPADVSPRNGRA